MENESLEHFVVRRFHALKRAIPDTISADIDLQLMECNEEHGEFLIKARTAAYMRNYYGFLHGGMIAMIMDQAMGHMAYCVTSGRSHSVTTEMNLSYLRPMLATDDVLIRVFVVSNGKALIRVRAEGYQASAPDRLCVTGTATYFNQPVNK